MLDPWVLVVVINRQVDGQALQHVLSPCYAVGNGGVYQLSHIKVLNFNLSLAKPITTLFYSKKAGKTVLDPRRQTQLQLAQSTNMC